MKLKVFTVDAFTSEAFSGNPAAVIPLDQVLSDETLQKIATEMNLSETAFLTLSTSNKDWKTCDRFGLRWFTPLNEVILCGHATLASAHALFNCMGNTCSSLSFDTLGGILKASRNKETDSITLDFPDNNPHPLEEEGVLTLGGLVEEVRRSFKVVDVEVSEKARKILVRIEDDTPKKSFESFKPDDRLLLSLHDGSLVKGLIVTMKGKGSNTEYSEYDFVSRYFAIWNGIPEDPVTGSAHTVLGPYWRRHLSLNSMKCRQCSPRGGDLTVTVRDDGRVDLTGNAVTVMSGEITF